jgi:hypothetical protein
LSHHPFVRGIFYYFGLQLCNLNPNSFIHITIFINLYEAHLGIAPHFDLFHYFFCLKSHPNDATPKVVGGAGFQLKQKHSAEYISVPHKSSNKGWPHEWFYMDNHELGVQCDADSRPIPGKHWDQDPDEQAMSQVRELLALIRDLWLRGLTGVAVMVNYASCCLQPLKERAHFAYEYAGPDFDTTHEVLELPPTEDLLDRIRSCFAPGTHITSYEAPLPFNLANPQPEVSFLSGFLDSPIGALDIMPARCLIKCLLFERPVKRSPQRLRCRTPFRGRTPGPGGCGSSRRWSRQRRPSGRVVMKEAAMRPR